MCAAGLAAGRPLHVQLNRQNSTISVVNKGLLALPERLSVRVAAYDSCSGVEFALVPPYAETLSSVPAIAVQHLPAKLNAPPAASLGSVVLYRIRATSADGNVASTTDYLLSTLNPDVAQNLTSLAAARYNSESCGGLIQLEPNVTARADGVDRFGRRIVVLNVTLRNPGPAVAVGVTLSLRCPATAVVAETGFVDDRVLPQWAGDGLFHLLRGEMRNVSIEATLSVGPATPLPDLFVVISGWNVRRLNVSVTVPVYL